MWRKGNGLQLWLQWPFPILIPNCIHRPAPLLGAKFAGATVPQIWHQLEIILGVCLGVPKGESLSRTKGIYYKVE